MHTYKTLQRITFVALAITGTICAQQATTTSPATAPAPAQPTTMTASLSKQLGMYIFPAKNQSPEVQSQDEMACYTWAVQQSGVDPLNMTATQAATVETGPDGTALRGAAKGALVGLAIGGIAGDAGKGAAIGATVGGVGGLGAKRQGDAAETKQAQATATATDAAKIEEFKKAYSVCLEGKSYTVK